MGATTDGDRRGGCSEVESILHPRRSTRQLQCRRVQTGSPDLEITTSKHSSITVATLWANDITDDLFTPRQLVALTTFCDLVSEARERIRQDAMAAGLPRMTRSLDSGGTGANAYAEAVSVYLGISCAQKLSILDHAIAHGGLQQGKTCTALSAGKPFRWFGTLLKCNPFAERRRQTSPAVSTAVRKCLSTLPATSLAARSSGSTGRCTDAERSKQYRLDRSAVLRQHRLRRSLGFLLCLAASVTPGLFSLTACHDRGPKAEELVATPYRHGSKKRPRDVLS